MKRVIPIVAGVGAFSLCRIFTSAAGGVSAGVLIVKAGLVVVLMGVVLVLAYVWRKKNGRNEA